MHSKSYDFYTRVRVPKIRIEGTYDLRGKILLIPLVGSGLCWFEPSKCDINIEKIYSYLLIVF